MSLETKVCSDISAIPYDPEGKQIEGGGGGGGVLREKMLSIKKLSQLNVMEHQCLSAKQRDCGAQREAEQNMAKAAVPVPSLRPEEECVRKGEGWDIMGQTVLHT